MFAVDGRKVIQCLLVDPVNISLAVKICIPLSREYFDYLAL